MERRFRTAKPRMKMRAKMRSKAKLRMKTGIWVEAAARSIFNATALASNSLSPIYTVCFVSISFPDEQTFYKGVQDATNWRH
jgi:hypothetical protein